MLRKIAITISLVIGTLLFSGCVTSSAPQTSTGEKIKISVLSDRGDPKKMESRQWQYRNEVGAYMERDLINRLNRTGYDANLITSRKEHTSGPGRYLVEVSIKSYNPGSSAARILVGFGAGACSLDIHYAVFGSGSKAIMEWDDGIGTAGDWRRLPVALNNKLVHKLNAELAARPQESDF